MKQVYHTAMYESTTYEIAAEVVAEGLELLDTHTDAVVEYDTLTSTAVDALIHSGEQYFRVTCSNGGITTYRGMLIDGEFVYNASASTNVSASGRFPFYGELIVINSGTYWGLSYYGTIDTGMTVRRVPSVCSAKIKSSLNGVVYPSGWAGNNIDRRFPIGDAIIYNGEEREFGHSFRSSSYASYNVPAGKMLLFPTLIGLVSENTLGVPTIGDEAMYQMCGESALSLYDEFYVNGRKYVSLGSVAIRST